MYKKTYSIAIILTLIIFQYKAIAQVVYAPFTIKYQTTQKGGITMASNTMSSSVGQNMFETPPSGTQKNNTANQIFVDIDGDPSTFASSSSTLAVGGTCRKVTYAALIWQGIYDVGGSQSAADIILATTTSYVQQRYRTIKFKTPASGTYNMLTADGINLHYTITQWNYVYECYKDVTNLVVAGGDGIYTAADIQSIFGTNGFTGWTLIVIYEDQSLSNKQFTIFNGLAFAQSNTVTMTITGFRTPPVGPVAFDLGVIGYDGDRGDNDNLRFGTSLASMNNVTNSLNPANDFLNSSITRYGSTVTGNNPPFGNTCGYDSDIFTPNNTNNTLIGNNVTQAFFQETATSEGVLVSTFVTAIESYEPIFDLTHYYEDLNGGNVNVNDEIKFTFTASNSGNDYSALTTLEYDLPPTVTLVPNSLTITGGWNIGLKTDAVGDDQVDYIDASRKIIARLGIGASATSGGFIPNYTSVGNNTTFSYRVKVLDDCAALFCTGNQISSVGTLYYSGNITSLSGSQLSRPLTTFVGCTNSGPLVGTVLGVSCSLQPDVTVTGLTCPADLSQIVTTPGFKFYDAGSNLVTNATAGGQYMAVRTITSSCSDVINILLINFTPCTPPIANNTTFVGIPGASAATSIPGFSGSTIQGSITGFFISSLPTSSTGILFVNGLAATINQFVPNSLLGALTFDPVNTFTGFTSFNILALNSIGLVSTASGIYTISIINNPPVANSITLVTTNGVAMTYPLFPTHVSDIENGILTYSIINTIPGLIGSPFTFVLNTLTGTFTYTSHIDATPRIDRINYRVCDNGVSIACTTAQISIRVPYSNLAPIPFDDYLTVNEDTRGMVTISGNDYDPNPTDIKYYAVISVPGNGTFTLNSLTGVLTYNPNLHYHGNDVITYRVCDSPSIFTSCGTALVYITVLPIIDPLTAFPNFRVLAEDATISGNLITDAVADFNALTGNATGLTATGFIGTFSGGNLTITGTGAYTYSPFNSIVGTYSTTYQVCNLDVCTTAGFFVTITGVVDNPIARPNYRGVVQGNDISGNLITDAVADYNPITLGTSGLSVNAFSGTITGGQLDIISTGDYFFISNATFTGTTSYTYTLCNADACTTSGLFITVSGANVPPISNTITSNVIQPGITTEIFTMSGTDFDGVIVAYIVQTIPPNGILYDGNNVVISVAGTTLTGSSTSRLYFRPNNTFTGLTTFNFMVVDDYYAISNNTGLYNITVVAYPPIPVNDVNITNENTSVSGTLLTNDFNPLTATFTGLTLTGITPSTAVGGTIIITNSFTGAYTFTPTAELPSGINTVVGYTYTLCNANSCTTAGLSITITGVNDPPVARNMTISGTSGNILINSLTLIALSTLPGAVYDADNNVLTVNTSLVLTSTGTLAATTTQGQRITITGNGALTYISNITFSGIDTYTLSVCDPLTCTSAVLLFSITGSSIPPIPGTVTSGVIPSGVNSAIPTLTGTDIDGTVIGFIITSLPSGGTLFNGLGNAITATGITLTGTAASALSFTPLSTTTGNITFNFRAIDNQYFVSTGTGLYTIVVLNNSCNYSSTTFLDVNGGNIGIGNVLQLRVNVSIPNNTTVFGTTLYQNIPTGLTYIPGTLRIINPTGITHAGPYTDATGDDLGQVVGNVAMINIGSGASSSSGGDVIGGSTTPIFGTTSIITLAINVSVSGSLNYVITSLGYSTYKLSPTATVITCTGGSPTYIQINPSTSFCNDQQGLNLFSNAFSGTFGSGTGLNFGSITGTNYNYVPFSCSQPQDGNYSVSNSTDCNGSGTAGGGVFGDGYWTVFGDHTGASDPIAGNPAPATGSIAGYMLVVNASYKPDLVITDNISSLCPDMNYEYSAWVRNICPSCGGAPFSSVPGVLPNLAFSIDDVEQYSSGDIPYTGTWRQVGFQYQTKPSQTSLNVKIRNNAPGGGGNDWALDDISFKSCIPIISFNTGNNVSVCGTTTLNYVATVTSKYSNYNNYKWQMSTNSGTNWIDISSPTTITTTLIGSDYVYVASLTGVNITTSDNGKLYAIAVGSSFANLTSNSCSFRSTIVSLQVSSLPSVNINTSIGNITATACNLPGGIVVTASGGNSYLWSNGSTTGAIVISASSLSGIYTVTATGTAQCSSSKTVTILGMGTNPCNTPPVVTNVGIAMPRTAPLTTIPGLLGSDADGVIAYFTVLTVPNISSGRLYYCTPGCVQITASGTTLTGTQASSLSFDPTGTYIGIETFTFRATDNGGSISTSTGIYTISITSVNTAPIARNITIAGFAGTTISGILPFLAVSTVPGAVYDLDLDVLTVNSTLVVTSSGVITALSSQGKLVTLSGSGLVRYISPITFSGIDTYALTVCDPFTCVGSTITFSVSGVPLNPLGVNDVNITNENSTISGTLLTNDFNPITATFTGLTLTGITPSTPIGGTIVITNSFTGAYIFTPTVELASVINTVVGYTYTLCNTNSCTTAGLSITITGVNDPPVVTSNSTSTGVNTPITLCVICNDNDPDGTLSGINLTTITSLPPTSQGTVTFTTITGSITFVPNPTFTGVTTFIYALCDNGNPVLCGNALVSIIVTGNVPPVIQPDITTTGVNTPVDICVLCNDSDPDGTITGSTLTITSPPVVSTGTVTIVGTTVRYIPNPTFTGVTTFIYSVCDSGSPQLCGNAIVTVSVTGNVPPILTPDNTLTGINTPITICGLDNDTDVDGTLNAASVNILSFTPINAGSFAVITATGCMVYTPNPTFTGVTTFIYRVCDNGTPTMCSTSTGTVTVSGNVPPVIHPDITTTGVNTPVDICVLCNDSDPDGTITGSTLTITSPPVVSTGTVTIVGTTVRYIPNPTFTGVTTFIYSVCDSGSPQLCGNGIVSVTVTSNPPVANPDVTTTGINTPVPICVLCNDTGGPLDPGSVKVITTFTGGTASVNTTTGIITFTPESTFTGVITFTYEVCTYTPVSCVNASVTLTVTGTLPNKPPVAVSDYFLLDPKETEIKGNVLNLNVLPGGINTTKDNDPDGSSDKLTVIPQTGVVTLNKGKFTLDATGNFSYSPAINFAGKDSIPYILIDEFGGRDTAYVVFIINLNDIFVPEGFSPNGDGTFDEFRIVKPDNVLGIEMNMYNRWGNLIYYSENFDVWDGKANTGLKVGELMPDGVYYWVAKIKYTNKETETKPGYVILNR
ncbi:MAG: Ig-like domain-containing protein [Cytophagales bacterium]|nr:Ig-like domain-containing protein [Cytophagales bacterium]